ncbi:MAG: MarR family winged helix-turn-helix transcriptional regulator [Novosphingobium sp.]|nr:MarR family winged helix-turn-helix transcriptional regulator [Novosphingobium sp.]
MPQPAVDPAREDVVLLIRLLKLASLINTPMNDGVCEPTGISQIELKVLMALSGEGELAGHDLVEIMGMPAMNVSRALAALRARGWIEDCADPHNRRRKPVRLTAEGRTAYDRLEPLLAAVAGALVGKLGKAERQRLGQTSDKLIAAMADWILGHHTEVRLRR